MSDDNQEIEELQADIENAWVALGMGDYEGEDDLAHFIAALKAENAALQAQIKAREWQDISSAPKDGTEILLYWPSYAYGVGEKSYPLVAFGSWKTNPRISKSYFSDSGEMDDYGLAQTEHAPTHWMAYHLPAAPVSQEKVG